MSPQFSRWLIERIVRKPVVFIGSAVEEIYDFFFRNRDIRLSKEQEAAFALEIKQKLPFLFSECGGVIVPLESVQLHLPVWLQHPRPSVVIVATDKLIFRFLRGHGELRGWVGSKHDPDTTWPRLGDLEVVLVKLGWREGLGPRPFFSLEDLAAALKPQMDRLKAAFSEEQYPEMKRFLAEAQNGEEAAARIASIELNRKLYG